MTSDPSWPRVKDLFQQALDQPAAERRDWLARHAGSDERLRRDVEALLAAHDTAGDFLERPPAIDPADLHRFPPGTRFGPYEILHELGRGGAGVVYLARDHRLGRLVALKLIAADAEPEFRDRLRREARAAATIAHPSVATIYALEEFDGQLFMISEYVRGQTLRAALSGGALPPDRALAVARGIAGALQAAHDAGVVHRDLKPENVLLSETGGVKVVDFGIARIDHAGATQLTRHGALLGTPAYMAPEQLLGTPADARTDIFAFGIVLSEMISGRHPGSSSVTGESHASAPLSAIARRCMQVDPGARFQSARDVIAALEQLDAGAGEARSTARWWWEFHQAAAALVYALAVWPAWHARSLIGGRSGRTLFTLFLVAVIATGTLRLHQWFTSRFYPGELDWVRPRSARWIAAGDALFALALVSAALLIRGEDSSLDVILIAIAIGAAAAAFIVEPATTRAAFRPADASPAADVPPGPYDRTPR